MIKKVTYTALVAAMVVAGFACSKAVTSDGTFEYKGVYLPDTYGETSQALGLNNIDDDWGIWGHNLNIVLPEGHSHSVYAHIDGEVEKEQFCFSSNKLFEYICDYIDDNYGREDKIRFAILPEDNGIVCQCRTCVIAGNTETDASPAVFEMIDKLAKEYPNHLFFTSYYSSTKGLPSEKMAPNTGVLISAMDYPRTAVSTTQEEDFRNLIKTWAEHTDNVYIWDYINNFDDYYTPSPILGLMQNRLKLYRDNGVKGVFLNGSGDDYSTFSGVKKSVLASLLHNPDTDWQQEVRDYCKAHYPVSGDLIADFILSQESLIAENGKTLPMYDGINEATRTYLDEDAFVKFYDALLGKAYHAQGAERKELESMVRAMAFTRLELMRRSGNIEGSERYLDILSEEDEVIQDYGEAYWPVKSYLRDFRFMKEHAESEGRNNMLKGVKLTPRTALDPDYSDISILTDGLLGIPSNYHSGNLLSSADPSLSIGVPHKPGMKKLKVWLVKNEHFHIGLPTQIMLKIGGLKYDVLEPGEVTSRTGRSFVEFDIPADASGEITLVVYKDPEVRTMAIDEIEAF